MNPTDIDIEGLRRLDALIAEYEADPAKQQEAEHARMVRDAEQLLFIGVDVRTMHVGVGDHRMDFRFSYDLVLLSRVHWQKAQDNGQAEALAAGGLVVLRDIVRAGRVEAETEGMRMWLGGVARMALFKLFDDLVLRRVGDAVGDAEPNIADEYWLTLSEDDVPRFCLLEAPPEDDVQDSQHRGRTLH